MKPNAFAKAGGTLLASPAAVFVAVLTAGLATASLGHHAGMCATSPSMAWRSSVVLACPRTNSQAHSKAAGASSAASISRQHISADARVVSADSPSASVANTEVPAEKHPAAQSTKTAGGGLSVQLPDFTAPELSRFISPL